MDDDPGAGDQTPAFFQLFNEIGIIEQLARARLERRLPEGLKLPHFSVLNHFVRLGGERNLVALARAFQVTKATMTHTVQRLEARGLVEVRPDPGDGRAKLVAITQAGRNLREASVAALAGDFAELTARFSSARVEAALPFLRELRRHLDENR